MGDYLSGFSSHLCCLGISFCYAHHIMPYAGMELILAAGESYWFHGLMFCLYLLYDISLCNFLYRLKMFSAMGGSFFWFVMYMRLGFSYVKETCWK